MDLRPNYFFRVGDALSQLGNVALLNGDANESISGRAFREQWAVRHVIDALFAWAGSHHCQDAYNYDLERARLLVESE